MKQITTKELAEKWGISQRRILCLAKGGRIPGAQQHGSSWLFPADAKKPADGRTRQAKAAPKETVFRFPLYVNGEEESFSPPLTEEEKLLRRAQLDCMACRFEKAEPLLDLLLTDTDNIYLKISALCFKCIASVYYREGFGCAYHIHSFNMLLAQEFPYKQEMLLFRPWLDLFFSFLKDASEHLVLEREYAYSPQVLPLLSYLTAFRYCDLEPDADAFFNTDVFEVQCRQAENGGYWYEAQETHLFLFVIYYLKNNETAMRFHLKQSLLLAKQYSMWLSPAIYEAYYSDAFNKVLAEFSPEVGEILRQHSNKIFKSFSVFSEKSSISFLHSVLNKNDYPILNFACQGYTNKEIAAIMNVSERTVAKKFTEIYEKTGAKNRHELLAMYFDIVAKKEI